MGKKNRRRRKMPNSPDTQKPVEEPRNLLYINFDELKETCHRTIESFSDYGETFNTPDGIYIHRKTGANILAVGHLDVVDSVKDSRNFCQIGKNIQSGHLDDRLGVYLLLHVLPTWGLKYDLLLTEGEEKGRSTAKHFKTDIEYNWIFELDRMGTTSVMYQYETPEYKKMLEEFGFKVAVGSCTDIKYLDHLGVWAVNFGIAYYQQHQLACYVNTEELEEDIIPKIVKFVDAKKDEKLIHVPKPATTHYYNNTSYGGWYRGDDDDDWDSTSGNNKKVEKPANLPVRFRYDSKQQEWYCPTCFRSYIECNTYYGCAFRVKNRKDRLSTNSENTCTVCNRDIQHCSGYEECPICKFHYHSSTFIEEFGVCYTCLNKEFSVNELFLLGASSYDKTTREQANSYIKDLIGGKYVETVAVVE